MERSGLTFSSGAQIITGALVVKFTNASSGESTTLNISGPVFTAVGATFQTLTGSSVIFYFPGEVGPGTPGAPLLTRGPVTITFNPATGALTGVDLTSAAVTDICTLLS
jgi:hypothetical protein